MITGHTVQSDSRGRDAELPSPAKVEGNSTGIPLQMYVGGLGTEEVQSETATWVARHRPEAADKARICRRRVRGERTTVGRVDGQHAVQLLCRHAIPARPFVLLQRAKHAFELRRIAWECGKLCSCRQLCLDLVPCEVVGEAREAAGIRAQAA